MVLLCKFSLYLYRAVRAPIGPGPRGFSLTSLMDDPARGPLNPTLSAQHWSFSHLSLSTESTSLEHARRNDNVYHRTSHTTTMMMMTIWLRRRNDGNVDCLCNARYVAPGVSPRGWIQFTSLLSVFLGLMQKTQKHSRYHSECTKHTISNETFVFFREETHTPPDTVSLRQGQTSLGTLKMRERKMKELRSMEKYCCICQISTGDQSHWS